MAQGSTQPLTEVSTRTSPGSKGGRCVGLTTLSPSRAVFLEILGVSNFWSPMGLSRPVRKGWLYVNHVGLYTRRPSGSGYDHHNIRTIYECILFVIGLPFLVHVKHVGGQ
jgi:hypothetical protein